MVGSMEKFHFSAGFQQQILEKDSQFGSEDKSCSEPMTTNYEEMATIGLDAMQRANSTIEDFVSSSLWWKRSVAVEYY